MGLESPSRVTTTMLNPSAPSPSIGKEVGGLNTPNQCQRRNWANFSRPNDAGAAANNRRWQILLQKSICSPKDSTTDRISFGDVVSCGNPRSQLSPGRDRFLRSLTPPGSKGPLQHNRHFLAGPAQCLVRQGIVLHSPR